MSLTAKLSGDRPVYAGNHVQKINQENEKKSRKKNSYLEIVSIGRDGVVYG
jgi:hypothetical protein